MARARIDAFHVETDAGIAGMNGPGADSDIKMVHESGDTPFAEIGHHDTGVVRRMRERSGARGSGLGIDEVALGRRVSTSERREILSEIVRIAKQNEIPLVLIHPSYKRTEPHDCLLTRFAQDTRLEIFDAHESLHPADLPMGTLFRDQWHPGVDGHARLAKALSIHLWNRMDQCRMAW